MTKSGGSKILNLPQALTTIFVMALSVLQGTLADSSNHSIVYNQPHQARIGFLATRKEQRLELRGDFNRHFKPIGNSRIAPDSAKLEEKFRRSEKQGKHKPFAGKYHNHESPGKISHQKTTQASVHGPPRTSAPISGYSSYCPSFCLSDHTWMPAKNCTHPRVMCCYTTKRRLHCCNEIHLAIDTRDMEEDYLCPSALVKWWSEWWPVVLGTILSVGMVTLIFGVAVCVFQVAKNRRNGGHHRSGSIYSEHSYHSDCSACRNNLRMNEMSDIASPPETSPEDGDDSISSALSRQVPLPSLVLVVSPDDHEPPVWSSILEPPPYEEPHPPPAYQP